MGVGLRPSMGVRLGVHLGVQVGVQVGVRVGVTNETQKKEKIVFCIGNR